MDGNKIAKDIVFYLTVGLAVFSFVMTILNFGNFADINQSINNLQSVVGSVYGK